MLRMISATIFVALLTVSLPSPEAFGQAHSQEAYEVGPGDSLTISVFGQAELSGTFTVDAEGYVQLPVADPLRIEGLTLKQTQSLLKDRLADGYVVNPEVSVRIDEVRPVIILGAVRRPGTFPFRFGMTVAEAVALAGGFGGEAQDGRSSRPQLIAAKERVALLNQNRSELMLRMTRSDAELSGDATLVPPPELATDADPRVLSMIAHQQILLSKFNEQYRRGLDLIRVQRERIDAEISALKEERRAAVRRVELAEEFLRIQEALKGKGLVRAATMLAAQTDVAEKEGRVAQYDGQLSSLSQAIGDLELQAQAQEKERIQRITEEKQDLLAKLNEVEVALPLAERIVELRQQEVGIFLETEGETEHNIYLTRRTSPDVKRAPVELVDNVWPGDILEVRISTKSQNGLSLAADVIRHELSGPVAVMQEDFLNGDSLER